MPAIWNGLVERFGARVTALPNRDRIIAEGAAWIAHDRLRLTLAKPIEVLVADGVGRGTYLPVVDAGLILPIEYQVIAADNKRFFCVDPRDGRAVFELTKPRKVGLLHPADERSTLCSLNLQIDPNARPFLERLECQVQIDHDYIAHVALKSTLRGETVEAEVHDLDFGLELSGATRGRQAPDDEAAQNDDEQNRRSVRAAPFVGISGGANVALRSNILHNQAWTLVPGDIVELWKPSFLRVDFDDATEFQREERMYYVPCAFCHRTVYEIRQQGANEVCARYACGEWQPRPQD